MGKTTKQAIREQCRACVGLRPGQALDEVRNCGGHTVYATGKPCPFYPFRLGVGRPRLRIIRLFCLECMGGHSTFVTDCTTADCPLHFFRMGKNPMRKSSRTPEEMAAVRAAIKRQTP